MHGLRHSIEGLPSQAAVHRRQLSGSEGKFVGNRWRRSQVGQSER